MVPDTPDVEAVLFGDNGVAAGLKGGGSAGARKTVVDMSSISPMATKAFARRIGELGADYVDAPVSGGEVGAKAATLTTMCGGDPAVFERVRPLLEKMGKNITLVGGVGDARRPGRQARSSSPSTSPRSARRAVRQPGQGGRRRRRRR